MLCVVSVAAHCGHSAGFMCIVCVYSVCGVVVQGSVWPQLGLSPVGVPRGSSFSSREVTDGVRDVWETRNLTVYGSDMEEFGGTQGGYKACGRLGNPLRITGYPGKGCDTQRVRTLGRGPGAHPGDWGVLGGCYGAPMGIVGHPRKGRGHRRGQRHLRRLWDTQEAGKIQGFIRHTNTAWTGLESPKGSGMIVGSPQKLILEPRPLIPPLFWEGETTPTLRVHGLTAGPHTCLRGARAARHGRPRARGAAPGGHGRHRVAACSHHEGGRR